VARDATARQYDVDADTVELDIKTGLIKFRAKKGRLVDLDKLHESIWATRLSGNTGMALEWIDVTATGRVETVNKEARLVVTGSDEYFVLRENPGAKPREGEKTVYQRLIEALDRGEKVVSVTGRVEGWKGHFPPFLKSLPKKPRVILVKDFRTQEPRTK
jgi:hypothetical protein